ncbi:MAG: DUF6288 domain-containing protein [Planctomycetota bacterium]
MSRLKLLLTLVICFLPLSVQAVYEKPNGFPWNLTLNGWHDAEMVQALPNGSFFLNVGPTGIRAQVTHEHPHWFTVRYVFRNSPAAGKVRPGDIIIGANGRVMDVPHQFGRRTVRGFNGPMTEMAKLIEDSQAEEGKLELIVWPDGNRSAQKTVEVQIEPVGRFSRTYPFNCARSDRLMEQLCEWLAKEYERAGRFEGRVHAHSACVLALMASGDDRYAPLIRRIMAGYYNKRYNSFSGGGFPSWNFGYDGIVLGEYYLLSKDRKLLPAMQSLNTAMAESQDWITGGFSHRPQPFIWKRVADGGTRGYGSMAAPGGLVMLGLSLFKAGGVEIDSACYERIHQAYLQTTNQNGAVGYGFASWDYAFLELKGESLGKAQSERGIGYRVPTDMKEITEYEVVWPTPDEPRYRPPNWLKTETDRVRVYVLSETRRLAIRDMSLPEPTAPYNTTGRPINHLVRGGTGALAHLIGNADNVSWGFMGMHLATACAANPDSLLDGHASTLMHTLWASLGAARASDRGVRHYMDGIKWWFIMAQTHDGSFVCMPGRDYASTDHVYANRNMPTATAALILGIKDGHIMITGAENPPVRAKPTDTEEPRPRPQATVPRSLAQLGADFKVTHNTREAQLIERGSPYAQVLRSLDSTAEQDDAEGAEAAEFARRLRAWITAENARLMEQARERPGMSVARTGEYVRRLSGINSPDARALVARLGEMGRDRDIRMLARYYEQFDRVIEQETQRGSTPATERSKQQIGELVERFLQKPGLPQAVLTDARALLAEIDRTLP